MKILVVRFSSIGDIVLTTPVIRTLKTQLQNSEVHYLTKPAYASILQANPYIDKIHTLQNSLLKTATGLRKEKFDLIIDLHSNLRSNILATLLSVKRFQFSKVNFEKWLMVKFKINKLPNVHIVDRYMATVKELGVKTDALGLDYFIPEKDEVENEWLPETHRAAYVAVVIGAQHFTKRLPARRLIELCDRINKPIILLGGKEDFKIGEEVESFFKKGINSSKEEVLEHELGKKALIYNACGKFNFNQSASMVKEATVVFSHDTGLMHVAAAFGKKVFSIWGNTLPEFGMYPYRTKFVVFENKKIDCRPCSKIGFNKCPKGHFKCMQELTFDFYLPD